MRMRTPVGLLELLAATSLTLGGDAGGAGPTARTLAT
jgi:hypothetical protein